MTVKGLLPNNTTERQLAIAFKNLITNNVLHLHFMDWADALIQKQPTVQCIEFKLNKSKHCRSTS